MILVVSVLLALWITLPAEALLTTPIQPVGPPLGNPGTSFTASLGDRHPPAEPKTPQREALESSHGGSQSPFWTNVTNGPAPSPRLGPAMAYDPALGKVILFGGMSGRYGVDSGIYARYYNDTWTFANGSWTNVTDTVGVAPPARAFGSLTFDPGIGELVLVGGTPVGCFYGNECRETWGLSWSGWTELSSSQTGPDVAVYDSSTGYIVGVVCSITSNGSSSGGGTDGFVNGSWVALGYNHSTNTTAPTPDACRPALVNDPAEDGIIMFGGTFEDGGVLGETYLYQNGNWSAIAIQSNPPPTPYPYIAYDNSSGTAILAQAGSVGRQQSTWVFNGTWMNSTQPPQPPDFEAGGLTWDALENTTVLFGGAAPGDFGGPGSAATGIATNQTWEWGTSPDLVNLVVAASISSVDVGVPVQYQSSFDGGIPPFHYHWTFGDGTTSGQISPTHNFSGPGIYVVNLSVTDSGNESAHASLIELVAPLVSSQAEAFPSPTDVGRATNFLGGLSGGQPGGNFVWFFGDGSSDAGPDPNATHTYSSPGINVIEYWANDSGGGRAHRTFNETANPALSPVSVEASNSSINLGRPMNFTANVSGGTPPYLYSWSFGDGGTGGNLGQISHIYTTNGPFTATVQVVDSAGSVVSGNVNLSVALNLSIFLNATLGAAPLDVEFAAAATGGAPSYSYVWSFGSGSEATTPTGDHTFVAPGEYNVSARVMDNWGHILRTGATVIVYPGGGPLQLSLAGPSAPLRVGQSTTFTAHPAGGTGRYDLSWAAVHSACRILPPVTLLCTSSENGSYEVSASVSDGAGHIATASVNYTVGAEVSESSDRALGTWAWIGGLVLIGGGAATVAAISSYRRLSRKASVEANEPYRAYMPLVPPALGSVPEAEPSSELDPLEDMF